MCTFVSVGPNAGPRITLNQPPMFTAEQIQAAHRKVQSGADFPRYIQAIKQLGVRRYQTYVRNGQIDYWGEADHRVHIPEKYAPLPLADTPNPTEFKAQLRAHQLGQTDYPTFVQMCADTGIERWEVCLEQMTCTYFDTCQNPILVEPIPV